MFRGLPSPSIPAVPAQSPEVVAGDQRLLSRYNHNRLTPGLGDGKIACTLSDQRRALKIEAAFVAARARKLRPFWPIYRPRRTHSSTGLKRSNKVVPARATGSFPG